MSLKKYVLGFDFRDNEEVANNVKGNYSAHLFADRAVEIINQSANNSSPLFLYLAFQSVHSPLQVPEQYEKPYQNIKNKDRRTYCGMVSALDEAIGNIKNSVSFLVVFDLWSLKI